MVSRVEKKFLRSRERNSESAFAGFENAFRNSAKNNFEFSVFEVRGKIWNKFFAVRDSIHKTLRVPLYSARADFILLVLSRELANFRGSVYNVDVLGVCGIFPTKT